MSLSKAQCCLRTGWTRVIVEKPFGRDSESFRQLSTDLYEHLTEDQMFRIDHYLGKELIENLTVRCCGVGDARRASPGASPSPGETHPATCDTLWQIARCEALLRA